MEGSLIRKKVFTIDEKMLNIFPMTTQTTGLEHHSCHTGHELLLSFLFLYYLIYWRIPNLTWPKQKKKRQFLNFYEILFPKLQLPHFWEEPGETTHHLLHCTSRNLGLILVASFMKLTIFSLMSIISCSSKTFLKLACSSKSLHI